jgi:molybdopterin-containing oxidoreductase family iron-sulfur binding subunit
VDLSRRSFFKMAGVVGAAAAGCGELPSRQLMPYVIPDENIVPGMPAFFAGTCEECSAGCGVVARNREGRVIKLEGNPLDPIGAGALCARGQAALQGLYNPDRLATPQAREADGTLRALAWDAALATLGDRLQAAAEAGPGRVALVGAPVGPTLERLIRAWLGAWRSDRWLRWEPLDEEPARAAGELCFGRRDLPVHRIDGAEAVVSFGAEFLETWRSPVEYTRQYAAFRVPHGPGGTKVGRLVHVGPRFGLTAANADQWIATRPGDEAAVALAVLHAIARAGVRGGVDPDALRRVTEAYAPEDVAGRTGVGADTIRRLAELLASADGALALAGTDDRATHVAAHLLNAATGNLGRTVQFLDGPRPAAPSSAAETEAFVGALRSGEIDVVVVAGANPVFSMPADAQLGEALGRVRFVAWCGIVSDETAEHASLLLPIDHALECWGDAAPRPGVTLLGQPVMQPVYATLPLGDVLIASAAHAARPLPWESTQAAVAASWRQMHAARGGATSFDAFWEAVRRDGGLFESVPAADVALRHEALARPIAPRRAPADDVLTLFAFPHLLLGDGRGANKPWLQEVPEPVSQLVWDTWVAIHPETARALGVERDDVLEVTSAHGVIEAPVHPTPHVRPGVLAVPFGQGHTAYGRWEGGRGANPWKLLAPGRRSVEVHVRPSGRTRRLVSVQYGLDDMLGRSIGEATSVDELARGERARSSRHEVPEPHEMRPPHVYPGHRWGMTIDLAACTGCSACVAACYAENNVPVVGRENVSRGQVMSWIRIERFVPKTPDAPLLHVVPMLCQQCDHAPCEPVCPVYASLHTDDGLNAQVYNRCIGTRYCNNNCPYKVRRFNWFPPDWPAPLHLQLNPDVTVRGAGVMEKCTFCVQRIRLAEESARQDGRPLADGEITTACQQACPARAITFGDMNDAGSAVMRTRAAHPVRAYRALEDLNTKPAIVYLGEVYRRREPA